MAPLRGPLLRYLATALASATIVAGLCLILNVLVDPLWYLGGNVITGVNYAFNERLAKVNRLLPRLAEYDCLILGSSTAALLPERQIAGHRCFNMGFSSGVVSELVLYARYLRARGFMPSLLIVGVDKFDFEGPAVAPNVPDFIRTGKDPPSLWRSYLSLDALDFSIRTLRGDYPNHRVFDRDFRSHALPRRRPYKPPAVEPRDNPPELHVERVAQYVELRDVFPGARAIAFVPPTNAWSIAQLRADGRLETYLETLRRIAAAYDAFLDFGIPSEMTASTANTYDGIHYDDRVNEHVVTGLISDTAAPGVDWRKRPPQDIAAAYDQALSRLISR